MEDRTKKMTFYLTEAEWLEFLRKRAQAGHTENSAYIVEALRLDGGKK